MEITSRPQPREMALTDEGMIAAIVLAGGRSTRMGPTNKLLATLDGKPLVRCVVDHLGASDVDEIVVVTGHMAEDVKAVLAGTDVRFVHNRHFAEGLSTSLRAGIDALDDGVGAALIALGDMPFVEGEHFRLLLDTFRADEQVEIVVATSKGRRGNPVLWGRRFFADLMKSTGDTGAKHLIGENDSLIAEVEIGEAARRDLDTPEALSAAGGEI